MAERQCRASRAWPWAARRGRLPPGLGWPAGAEAGQSRYRALLCWMSIVRLGRRSSCCCRCAIVITVRARESHEDIAVLLDASAIPEHHVAGFVVERRRCRRGRWRFCPPRPVWSGRAFWMMMTCPSGDGVVDAAAASGVGEGWRPGAAGVAGACWPGPACVDAASRVGARFGRDKRSACRRQARNGDL